MKSGSNRKEVEPLETVDTGAQGRLSDLGLGDEIVGKLSGLSIKRIPELEIALRTREEEILCLPGIGSDRLKKIRDSIEEYRITFPIRVFVEEDTPAEPTRGPIWGFFGCVVGAVAMIVVAAIGDGCDREVIEVPVVEKVEVPVGVNNYRYDWPDSKFRVSVDRAYLRDFKKSEDDQLVFAVFNESKQSGRHDTAHLDYYGPIPISKIDGAIVESFDCPNASKSAELGDKIYCWLVVVPADWVQNSDYKLTDFRDDRIAERVYDWVGLYEPDVDRLGQVFRDLSESDKASVTR